LDEEKLRKIIREELENRLDDKLEELLERKIRQTENVLPSQKKPRSAG
jgi:hypothetical protein